MDFDPGKSFFIALVALFGALLVYLAVTGRYQAVGAALSTIAVLPNGATLANAFSQAGPPSPGVSATETTAGSSLGVSANDTASSTSSTSSTSSHGRAP